MGALLWIDTDKDEAISLGDPFRLRAAFAEMARVVGSGFAAYAELFGVPDACAEQEDVDPDWLALVRRQAGQLLREHGRDLGDVAQAVLAQLTGDLAAHAEIAQPPPDQRQDTAFRCVPAVLQSALQHFGVRVSEDYLAKQLGTTKADGTPPAAVLRVAAAYGLAVRQGWQIDPEHLAERLDRGELVLCYVQMYGHAAYQRRDESGHAVLVYDYERGDDGQVARVKFQDPAATAGAGRRSLPVAEFVARWHDRDSVGKTYTRYGIFMGRSFQTNLSGI